MRTGIYDSKSIAHKVIPLIKEWGVDLMTVSVLKNCSYDSKYAH